MIATASPKKRSSGSPNCWSTIEGHQAQPKVALASRDKGETEGRMRRQTGSEVIIEPGVAGVISMASRSSRVQPWWPGRTIIRCLRFKVPLSSIVRHGELRG